MGKNAFDADIVVVGGGLVGQATAVCVAKRGFKTIHLAPAAPADSRTSALMSPSVAFLVEAGLIEKPDAIGTALTKIRIIDATNRMLRAPETLFDSAETGHAAFGWNFTNQKLLTTFSTMAKRLQNYQIIETKFESQERTDNGYVVRTPDGQRITCRLIIGADGKKSPVRVATGIGIREHKFAQSAFVCDLELGRPLEGTSVEFHYPDGPFTLVPAGGNRANLVWIDKADILQKVRDEGDEAIIEALNARSMHLFGRITLASPTFVFPLSTLSAEVAGRDGIILAGESAHAFPPIGAQGLNLGLRDIADLMASLDGIDTAQDGWAERVSIDYAQRREGDLQRTSTMVDALFKSLLADMLPAQALRAGGLWALKLLPHLRKQAFAFGMGVR